MPAVNEEDYLFSVSGFTNVKIIVLIF